MPEFFSSDGPYYLQFLVIFLVILVLLMGVVLLFRRVAGRGLSLSAKAGNRSRQPRLGIVDIYELDRHRQLILLRRDNVEHLLLVGGPNDVVVERNVIRGAGSRLPGESLMRPEPASDMAPEQDGRRDAVALGASSFEMPLVVPPPMSGTNGHESAAPHRPPPLDPALFEPEAAPADRAPADRAPAEPVKPRIGISQVGRILRRTPPPLVDPRPDVASERVRPMPPAEPPPAAEAPEPQSIVPPSLMSSGPPRPIDPAALSDMASQLETALRRQSPAVPPPPGQGAPAPAIPDPMPAPPPPVAPSPPAEPVIAMATARPNPSFLIGRANPVPPPPPEPAPPPEPRPDPIAAAMAGAPTPPPASPPPAPEEKPAPPSSGTPFTVEEIETEFARLLGRPLDRKS